MRRAPLEIHVCVHNIIARYNGIWCLTFPRVYTVCLGISDANFNLLWGERCCARGTKNKNGKTVPQKRINVHVRHKFEYSSDNARHLVLSIKDWEWYDLAEFHFRRHTKTFDPYVYSATTETRQLARRSCSRISHSGNWTHRNYMEITPVVNCNADTINIPNLLWKYQGASSILRDLFSQR